MTTQLLVINDLCSSLSKIMFKEDELDVILYLTNEIFVPEGQEINLKLRLQLFCQKVLCFNRDPDKIMPKSLIKIIYISYT